MRGFSRAFAVCLLLFAWVLPAIANAGDESADAEFTITPKSGATFFNNAFSAAQGTVNTVITLPGPSDDYPKITPMKVADLRFPPARALTFNPKPSMPVCPDGQLGPPPTTNSVPVPQMIARCPKALIGNGTALFALARNTKPSAARDGELLIFNGGRVDGLPKIKVYSYSYDLQVGIYTSAILQPDGRLRFEIPSLPVDSAVTAMKLAIPGRRTVRPKPTLDTTVILPAGLDANYIQVKCAGKQGLPWSADYTLGERDTGGNPINGPELFLADSGTVPCTGMSADPRIAGLKVTGPGRALRNRMTVFRVRVRNTGGTPATGGRLLLSGRGVRAVVRVGNIAGGQSRTVTIRAKFRVKGLVRATIRLNTKNAGSKVVARSVRVR